MEPVSSFKHKKVMVIDDNEIDRYVAKLVIEKNAFAQEIVCMESAKEALAYLKNLEATPEELPHLIFLDINMPGMSGFDFLREYNNLSDSVKKNCIIMMLTTSLNEQDRIQAEENEFVYMFLNKPLDKEKLNGIDKELKE
jgi:CheY-like chemotaxis protein